MYNILLNEAQEAADYIRVKFASSSLPKIAVILGSGLGGFTKVVKRSHTLKYCEIPHFPRLDVAGHKGRLSIAEVDGAIPVLVMEGRFHAYEGYAPNLVTFPVTVLHLLGIETLIVSNASGGINVQFKPGDLMIIDDHINFTGSHPLIGKNYDHLGARFLDQTESYSQELIRKAIAVAKDSGVEPKQGVYLGLTGPTYETKAEINAFRILGADAVGMSTVHEVIMANYFKIRVLAISNITNMATGIAATKHDHAEVVRVASQTAVKFANWVKAIIQTL